MDPGVGDEIRLELRQVNVEGPVEPQRGRDRGDNLSNQPVEVGVRWPLDVQVASTDVVDGLVVHHEGAVSVLKGGVGGQDCIVRLHHCCRNLTKRTKS